jgi:diphthamide synthase subunit DPH2
MLNISLSVALHLHVFVALVIAGSRRVCLMGTIQFVAALHDAKAHPDLKDHFQALQVRGQYVCMYICNIPSHFCSLYAAPSQFAT